MSLAILLDCDEDYMRNRSIQESIADAVIAKRLSLHKYQTLPVLGHLDDNGKLTVVRSKLSLFFSIIIFITDIIIVTIITTILIVITVRT